MELNKYRFYPVKFVLDPNCNAYDVYVSGVGVTSANDLETCRKMGKELVLDWSLASFMDHKIFNGAKETKEYDEILDIGGDAALKIMLRNLLVKNKVTQNELGRRLGLTKSEMSGAVNPRKSTKFATLLKCFDLLEAPLQVSC